MDIMNQFPDFTQFLDAMERGDNLYNSIYPRDQLPSTSQLSGKKRKNPFNPTMSNPTKKKRIE